MGEAVGAAGIDPRPLLEEAIAGGAFAAGLDGPIPTVVLAAIHAAAPEARSAALEALLDHLHQVGRPVEDLAKVLLPYRDEPTLADLVTGQPDVVLHAIRLLEPRCEADLRALLAAGKPVAVLEAIISNGVPAGSPLLLEALETLVERCPEPDALAALVPYYVTEAVERLEKDPAVDRTRLGDVEVHLIGYLEGRILQRKPLALFHRMTCDPECFVDIVSRSRDPSAPRSPLGNNAELALWDCPLVPGRRPDGSIDPDALEDFVARARALAACHGLAYPVDYHLGMLLYKAPGEPDGTWPCEAVARVLDPPDRDDLRDSFVPFPELREVSQAAR